MSVFKETSTGFAGVPEVSPEVVEKTLGQKNFKLIDVRRPDEFTGELGHIAGATLVTLETDFAKALETWPREETYVFVCRSGQRSAQATNYAQSRGFGQVYNLAGGMIAWNRAGLKVER